MCGLDALIYVSFCYFCIGDNLDTYARFFVYFMVSIIQDLVHMKNQTNTLQKVREQCIYRSVCGEELS